MDKRVLAIINDKINNSISNEALKEVLYILDTLKVEDKEDLALGIIIGRVYNAFHYQTRRQLGRDARREEFEEFVHILRERLGYLRGIIEKIIQ